MEIVKAIVALIFVIALMGGLALALKKLGLSGHIENKSGKKRLKIIESLPLDQRRRLVIIQRDDTQHLVILGPNSETLVETNITHGDNENNV